MIIVSDLQMIKQVHIYSSVKPLVPDVFCVLQKMPDSVLLEFLEKVLVTWFGIDMFDFPMGPCLNSLDTPRAQYWACDWSSVSVCYSHCPGLHLSVPTSEKTTGCWEQWGKILFLVPEPFMLLCDRVGSWEPLQATSLPPFSYPLLYYLCSYLRHGRFLVCQGELRLSVLRLECCWDIKKW